MKITPLNEMAYERADAIQLCLSLGKKFIEHFNKVVQEGKHSQKYAHHCSEMNAWWNMVNKIVLKSNKKPISTAQLKDWFFEVGSSVEFIIDEKYQDIYNKLIVRLSYDYTNSVKSVMDDLI